MGRSIVVLGALAGVVLPLAAAPSTSAAEPLFDDPVVYPNGPLGGGESHRTVVARDLDGDGDLDLAFSDTARGQVHVMFGDGLGGFAAPTAYSSGGLLPGGIDAADLDGDGDLDLLVANSGSSALALLANDGDGGFAPGATVATTPDPTGVHAGDVDGDGRMDVVAHSATAIPGVTVWLGNGDGTLHKAQQVPTGLVFVTSLGVADLDDDGLLDLIAGDATLGFYPMLGRGDGTFDKAGLVRVGGGHEDLTVADVDDDGIADVVVGEVSRNKVKVFLGRGDGTFLAPIASTVNPDRALLPPTFLVAVTAEDWDRDGDLDLALSGGTDEHVYVMLGDGTGSFSTVEAHDVGAVARTLTAGDVNHDGCADLVVAASGEVDVLTCR